MKCKQKFHFHLIIIKTFFANKTNNSCPIFCLQKYAAEKGDQGSLVDSMNTQYFYYTRTKGLFRVCYPKERPPTGECRNNLKLLSSFGFSVPSRRSRTIIIWKHVLRPPALTMAASF